MRVTEDRSKIRDTLKQRLGSAIVPKWNPNLLCDEPLELLSTPPIERGKFVEIYKRRRRTKAGERSARKLHQTQHFSATMRQTQRITMKSDSLLQDSQKMLTQPLTSQTQTLRGEFFMSPEHFQGPAGGVMTETFERELQKRIEQANPPNEQWHGRWPRTLLCDRCGEFSSAVEGGCLACDIVIHYACMTDLERTELRDGEFVCDVCSAFRMDNDAMFRFWKDKLIKLQAEKQCVKKVVGLMRQNFSRRKYQRLRRAACAIQRMIRRFLFVRRVLRYRRDLVRPMKISILSVEGLTSPFTRARSGSSYYPNPYVIMTVMDLFGRVQYFKFKGDDLKQCLSGDFRDEFMIPGVSAHVLLVFTLVHRRKPDDPVPRDIFLGQAVLGLQSLVALTIGERECTLDLGDIEYVPMETPYSEVKMEAINNYKPTGKLRIVIKPYLAVYGQVGSVFGPSLDVWKRRATHISNLELGNDASRKTRWHLVLADGRLFVFKKEGQTEPKVSIDTRELMIMGLQTLSQTIVLHLYDRTKIPLSFETSRQLSDWWFALTLSLSIHKGMSLQRFVSRVVPRADFWGNGASVHASTLASIEKRARASNMAAQRSAVPALLTPRGAALLSQVGEDEGEEDGEAEVLVSPRRLALEQKQALSPRRGPMERQNTFSPRRLPKDQQSSSIASLVPLAVENAATRHAGAGAEEKKLSSPRPPTAR